MTASDPSILIVGAGPTGLSAAVELSRRGFAPRIIERKNGPTPLSKAVGISPHSLDILEPSGVGPRLIDRGIRIRHAHIWYRMSELGTIDFAMLPHRFNFLLSLPQSETETIMADVLAERGVVVEWGTTLAGFEDRNGRLDASLDGGNGREEARFDVVFGADGVHSMVREAVGLRFDGRTHRRVWSIVDIEIADWPYEPGAAQLFLHDHGDIGFIIPIGEQRYRIVSNIEHGVASIPGTYKVSRILRSDTFRIPVRQAESYQRGRVFLGGDAAHVQSPVGARGMNLGIEDAACFARRFAANELDGYTAERRPVGRRWLKLSERILAAAQASDPLAATARNSTFRAISLLAPLQRPVLERFAGLRE